jgi:cell division septation protein DedD
VGDTRNRERFTLALRPVSAEGQAPATPPGPAAAPDSTARPDPEAAPDPAVAPAAAPADPDPSARPAARAGYRVRVGIFRHPDRERLARLERFGPLGTEPRDGGLTAFFLGPFPDAAAAADVLARVRAAGHTDAFVEYVQP